MTTFNNNHHLVKNTS